MIKASKIKELVFGKVANLLEPAFLELGFKYSKTKKQFIRQYDIYTQIVSLVHSDSAIIFDEDKEEIYLNFYLYSKIEIPNYEKWYEMNLDKKANLSNSINNIRSYITLSMDEFKDDNFYTPTKSQSFKMFVSQTLAGSSIKGSVTNYKNFDELLVFLDEFIKELEENSDIIQLFNRRTAPFDLTYIRLLSFSGFNELAKDHYDKVYDYYLEKINELKLKGDIKYKDYTNRLDDFISSTAKIANIIYNNPLNRAIKLFALKNEKFVFSDKVHFIERLRIDISDFKIDSLQINSKGDILLFVEKKTVFIYNSKGDKIFESEIILDKKFNEFRNVKSGVLKDSDEFYINHYIIRGNSTMIELPLPVETPKGQKIDPDISYISFSAVQSKYYILYANCFMTYNSNCELLSKLKIANYSCIAIVTEKDWIVAQERDNALVILNFNGIVLHRFEYGNGNNYFEFSPSFDYLICFFYSTKSQFFQISSNKQNVMWAHPTYIKNYKEKLYSDVNHNFGMDIAKFSPDEKYIIGGGDHGKYVAWTMPKLERKELIPQKELLDKMEYTHTEISKNESRKIITKTELIELDNQIFLKNRGNGISSIFFLDSGDVFLTELGYGNYILSWNRDFENLIFYKIEGRIQLYSDIYLSIINDKELVIYHRE